MLAFMVRTKILHDLLQKVLLLDNYSAKKKEKEKKRDWLTSHVMVASVSYLFSAHYLTISLAKYSPMTSTSVLERPIKFFLPFGNLKLPAGLHCLNDANKR